MPSERRTLLVRILGGAAFVALCALGTYRALPARADSPPLPSDQAPFHLALSGYAELDGAPIDGVRRVRHVLVTTPTWNEESSSVLMVEEKDERFVAGRYTATLGDCSRSQCINSSVSLRDALAGLEHVYVVTQFCANPTPGAAACSWLGTRRTEPLKVSTSLYALATPSQRLIGVWQSTASAACTIAGPSATAIPQLSVSIQLPQTSRLEVTYAVAAKARTAFPTSSSGLQVGVGPASQSTDLSSGSPRLVWNVSAWPQSRITRSATDLRPRLSSSPVAGAFASHSFNVTGVAPGPQTIMVAANTAATSGGEVDICGRGSSARAMLEDSVLTVLAFAE
jgi:hypothetical protein